MVPRELFVFNFIEEGTPERRFKVCCINQPFDNIDYILSGEVVNISQNAWAQMISEKLLTINSIIEELSPIGECINEGCCSFGFLVPASLVYE